VRSGVKFGDGDGTIATLSLGAMCVKGWQGKTRWNPAGIKVVTQGEYEQSKYERIPLFRWNNNANKVATRSRQGGGQSRGHCIIPHPLHSLASIK
jgi:hypothetical protein